MFFELTDSLADEILFSMEDQTETKVVDASKGSVISASDCDEENAEQYYPIPEWTSSDGYKLLEEFVNSLHSPLARNELKMVLVSGRGVFRNFKNVLKQYPEVERRWHFYKNKKMRERMNVWYNELRETWGLERLENADIEDLEYLVQNDFMFRQYDSIEDGDVVLKEAESVAQEYVLQFPGELGLAVADLWIRQSSSYDKNSKFGYVSHSLSNEFAGCILFSCCPLSAKKTVLLTDFFVIKNFRGLGIGQELLRKGLSGLREQGIQWVLLANTVIPKTMEPLLFRMGFERLGSGFMVDLYKEV